MSTKNSTTQHRRSLSTMTGHNTTEDIRQHNEFLQQVNSKLQEKNSHLETYSQDLEKFVDVLSRQTLVLMDDPQALWGK